MRNWKNWFFPLLTCFIAVGLALLPLRLSMREDGALSGVVHSEALREDSNFPAKVPELSGRIRLLAQRESIPDVLTIMDQSLEDAALEEAAAQVQKELLDLAAAGLLPLEAVEALGGCSGSRLYLRNQSDLSSASFLEMNAWQEKEGVYFWLVLDGETGSILTLQLFNWPMIKFPVRASETGRYFLERLNVSYEEMEEWKESGLSAVFRLPESQALYFVDRYDSGFTIRPEVDLELLERTAQEGEPPGNTANAALGYDG